MTGKGKTRKEVTPDFIVEVNTERAGVQLSIGTDDDDTVLDFTVVGNKIIPHFTNTDASGMDMGEARECLLRGDRVAREGWNGKDMYLECQMPDENSKMTQPYVYMKTADDELIPWLCSQADFFAGDWMVVLEAEQEQQKGQGAAGNSGQVDKG